LTHPYPDYEAIGIRSPSGEYNQLATTLLQIENEFYGAIRPKRVTRPGERPLHALRDRGVEYVEVRCMDLDPFMPIGIAAPTARFLDMFLLHCLLAESPPDTPQEIAALVRNQERVCAAGREPGLRLERGDRKVALTDWSGQILEELAPIATAMDAAHGGTHYRDTLRSARAALQDERLLPSARVLAAMAKHFEGRYVGFIRAQSERARRALLEQPWSDEAASRFRRLSEKSIEDQKILEASDRATFEDYRRQYLSQQ
jgi:glutamate--cysteine ligase